MNILGEFLGELVANEVGWRIGRGIRSGVFRIFGRRSQGSPRRQGPPPTPGRRLGRGPRRGRHRPDN